MAERNHILDLPVFGFRLETIPYIGESLNTDDYHYSINSDIKITVELEKYNCKINSGNFSKFVSISGKRSSRINFSIDLYEMSNLTTAPSFFDILESCGWKRQPIENGIEIIHDSLRNRVPATIEIAFAEEINEPRQIVFRISGAMGTVKFSGQTGLPIKAEFEFTGILENIETRFFENMIFPSGIDDCVPTALISSNFLFYENEIPMDSFEIDSGETISLFSNICRPGGYDGARMTDRASSGSVVLYNGADLPADTYEDIVAGI
jgi:hypothetical protein